MTETPASAASQYLKQPGFHRRFTLPATEDHDALEIGYSDLGRQPTDGQPAPPVMLFMPGMFAMRLMGALMDIVGQKKGVRILTVDRFGIGQSTNVPLEKRITTWLELVPKLLAHLDISHVSLVSHSAGTLYLLNTLYSCRDILEPARPYAVLMAPWIDVQHSGVTTMQAAQLLPSAALSYVDTFSRSFAAHVGPALDAGLSYIGSWFAGSSELDHKTREKHQYWQREYGVSPEFLNSVLEATVQEGFKENAAGLNDEARLCLRRGSSWAECDDFEQFVKKLSALEASRDQKSRLLVKVLFAEQDAMTGARGQKYMESCWEQNAKDGQKHPFDVIMQTIQGTDHDGVGGKVSVLEDMLSYVVEGST